MQSFGICGRGIRDLGPHSVGFCQYALNHGGLMGYEYEARCQVEVDHLTGVETLAPPLVLYKTLSSTIAILHVSETKVNPTTVCTKGPVDYYLSIYFSNFWKY